MLLIMAATKINKAVKIYFPIIVFLILMGKLLIIIEVFADSSFENELVTIIYTVNETAADIPALKLAEVIKLLIINGNNNIVKFCISYLNAIIISFFTILNASIMFSPLIIPFQYIFLKHFPL